MEYLQAMLLLALLICIGIVNYRCTKKTARRLIDQCTPKQ